MTDPGQTPLIKWLKKYRIAIYWLLLISGFIAFLRGVLIALPLGFAFFTIEAVLAKRILARKKIITRAAQPSLYWIYIGIWTCATLYALVLLFQNR